MCKLFVKSPEGFHNHGGNVAGVNFWRPAFFSLVKKHPHIYTGRAWILSLRRYIFSKPAEKSFILLSVLHFDIQLLNRKGFTGAFAHGYLILNLNFQKQGNSYNASFILKCPISLKKSF